MIRTGFETRGLDPEKAIDALNASVPLGRIAEPEDIADVVVFLASDQARYLCGTLIEANGGKPVQRRTGREKSPWLLVGAAALVPQLHENSQIGAPRFSRHSGERTRPMKAFR